MPDDACRIVLDIRPVGDSLTGRASTSSGRFREFTGWVGLFGALQALLPEVGQTMEEEQG